MFPIKQPPTDTQKTRVEDPTFFSLGADPTPDPTLN